MKQEMTPVEIVDRRLNGNGPGGSCFQGRAQRSDFWLALFLATLAVCITALPLALYAIEEFSRRGFDSSAGGCIIAAIVICFLAFMALIPVSVRRFHDLGLSGWFVLIFWLVGFVPVLGWLAGIVQLVLLGFIPGQKGTNQYGPDPARYDDVSRAPGPTEPVPVNRSQAQGESGAKAVWKAPGAVKDDAELNRQVKTEFARLLDGLDSYL